jgi:hypothetical protein
VLPGSKEQGGDEEPDEREKHADPEQAARQPRGAEVVGNHGRDCKSSNPVQGG